MKRLAKLFTRVTQLKFLIILAINSHLYAQNYSGKDTNTLDSSLVKKKSSSVPPFKLIDKDTISLAANDELVHDHYSARGMTYAYDALHAFNYRRGDKFGGYLNSKVNAGMERVRKKGYNSDIKKLYIQIDPMTLTVYWFAVVGPSADGKCYTRIDSRGSAGGGLTQVDKQLPNMHALYPNLQPVKLMEFNENVFICFDNNGNALSDCRGTLNIRQHFYKYKDPSFGTKSNDIASSDTTALNPENPIVQTKETPAENEVVKVKKKVVKPSYKIYKVKNGDTLSEIGEKFHVGVSKIKKLNGLKSDTIQIGQSLKIPK